MRDPAAMEWMGRYLNQKMPDGRTYGVHLAEAVPDMKQRLSITYQAYEKALRAHKVTQNEAARQKDMEDARHGAAYCGDDAVNPRPSPGLHFNLRRVKGSPYRRGSMLAAPPPNPSWELEEKRRLESGALACARHLEDLQAYATPLMSLKIKPRFATCRPVEIVLP